jgi:hypothetical protein
MSSENIEPSRRLNVFQRFLTISAIPVFLFAAILVVRIIWEETSLTLRQGPQMIGFSLAHGGGAVLLLAPILLVVWVAFALPTLIVVFARKRDYSKLFPTSFMCVVALLGLLSLPPIFWQWLLMPMFAKSSHAVDLMVYAAAEGDVRTVIGYLAHGVPVESKNYEGSTAAFTGAVSGNVKVLELLTERGADLNAVNSYGDSPLEVATEGHHAGAIAFLKAHGGVVLKGTPEQRSAASEAIVRRQIEEEKHWH